MSYFRLAGPATAVHGNHLFTLPLAQPCTLNRIEAPEAIERDIRQVVKRDTRGKLQFRTVIKKLQLAEVRGAVC